MSAIVHVTPTDDGGTIALVAYVGVIQKADIDWLRDWRTAERYEVPHTSGNVLEVLTQDVPAGVGPVFIRENAIFRPFIMFVKPEQPFHCEDCGKIAVEFLLAQQPIWAKEFHNDWYQANCLGNGRVAQRLN